MPSAIRANYESYNWNWTVSVCGQSPVYRLDRRIHESFGGRGNSSFGSREQGRYAVEFYTQVKTAYIHSGVL